MAGCSVDANCRHQINVSHSQKATDATSIDSVSTV